MLDCGQNWMEFFTRYIFRLKPPAPDFTSEKCPVKGCESPLEAPLFKPGHDIRMRSAYVIFNIGKKAQSLRAPH